MITRRNFIKRAVAGTAMLSFGGVLPEFSAKSYANIVGANDRIQIGCIGVNSRGAALARIFQTGELHHKTHLRCRLQSFKQMYCRSFQNQQYDSERI